ncbi:MAG TPA: DNA methyltransferase [Anaerolineae bacterium]|nr:DNA methyltransferase [Anaerolineae bacterium]
MADWRNRIVGLEYHKPGEIADHPLQWRVHSTAQEAALRAVLSEVGIAGALLAYRNNGGLVAIDGHLRKSLDADAEWPVLLLDVTEDEANKLLATTDPLAAMAGADAAMLGDLLAVIETENDTLQALLDGLAEEHGIEAEKPDDPGAQIDKAEELRVKWGVELGQVWEIGDHRLVCGDCTDAAVVAAVMRGERAQLGLTDFPYANETDYGDYRDTEEGLHNLIARAMPMMLELCDVTFVACGIGNVFSYPRPSWILSWHWEHTHSGSSRWGFNNWQPILVYGNDPYLANGLGRRQDSIPLHGIEKVDLSHPCPKPVETWSWFLERGSISKGDTILDPFLGSGTTLVACERLGRRGRGIELSPGYCAVSIQRLADMGLTPLLAGG